MSKEKKINESEFLFMLSYDFLFQKENWLPIPFFQLRFLKKLKIMDHKLKTILCRIPN